MGHHEEQGPDADDDPIKDLEFRSETESAALAPRELMRQVRLTDALLRRVHPESLSADELSAVHELIDVLRDFAEVHDDREQPPRSS
jgi:hypothetical protein